MIGLRVCAGRLLAPPFLGGGGPAAKPASIVLAGSSVNYLIV